MFEGRYGKILTIILIAIIIAIVLVLTIVGINIYKDYSEKKVFCTLFKGRLHDCRYVKYHGGTYVLIGI